MSIYNNANDILSGDPYNFIRVERTIYIGGISSTYEDIVVVHELLPQILLLRKDPRSLDAGTLRYLGYRPIVQVGDPKPDEYPGFIRSESGRGETLLELMKRQDPLRLVEYLEPFELQTVGITRESFR